MDGMNLKFERILNDNSRSKMVSLLCSATKDGKDEYAIVLLEKMQFNLDKVNDLVAGIKYTSCIMSNDVYQKLSASHDDNAVAVQLIFPATQQHISKYSKNLYKVVLETPSVYRETVAPYIDRIPPARTAWVDNIFSGKSEQERIIFMNDQFVILPDSKWTQASAAELYLLAIIKDPAIRSLRDLNGTHVGLLLSLRKEAVQAALHKYGVAEDELRVFVHYQPSYYRFHVHICHVMVEYPGMFVGQSHLLDDIIDNLSNIDSEYYQKRTLSYSISVSHDLYQLVSSKAGAAPGGL